MGLVDKVKSLFNGTRRALGLTLLVGTLAAMFQYSGRIMLMQQLCDFLLERGMRPVHIKLHGGGTPQEQRDSPAFGNSGYTTYEIIHCVLEREKLAGF